MKQHIQKHSIERRIDQTALRLLLKPVQIWEGPPKSSRKSSQRTVGGSKIDTNRVLLGHDELGSKMEKNEITKVHFFSLSNTNARASQAERLTHMYTQAIPK